MLFVYFQNMKKVSILLVAFISALASLAQSSGNKYYELRVYYCLPGRLDALIERFSNHTTKLFEKHGMENIGYWVPAKNDSNALYYILAFPSPEARDKSWKGFIADPEWKDVAAKSEVSGKIIRKIVSTFMYGADLLPEINSGNGAQNRLFELRTYTCSPDRLGALKTRFKDHTLKLFEKHGMQNIGYWTTVEPNNAQGKLLYIVGHQDEASAKKSWDAFRADPDWVKARTDSEASGKIVEKVESMYLQPLAFSKIR